MGARGPGAKPVRKKATAKAARKPARRPNWQRKGLTRGERVIRFCEGLTVTSGPDAGKRVQLRPWPKAIIRRVYDGSTTEGRRPVRLALLTMGRQHGKTALCASLARDRK